MISYKTEIKSLDQTVRLKVLFLSFMDFDADKLYDFGMFPFKQVPSFQEIDFEKSSIFQELRSGRDQTLREFSSDRYQTLR